MGNDSSPILYLLLVGYCVWVLIGRSLDKEDGDE